MLTIPHDDARAMRITAILHDGDVAALGQQLRDDPALATCRIVDPRGVARSLLHVVADWPGHRPQGARVVAILAAAGADVNARVVNPADSGAAETPLHWAASSDDVAVLDALLDAGADIEAPGAVFTGGTPLSDAVIFAQWRAARRLVGRGAQATIWQAAALGLLSRVQSCCEAEPRPSPAEVTNALWHACRGGQQSAATYLLEQGADPHWVGHDGKTPLEVARESGNVSLLEWLRRL